MLYQVIARGLDAQPEDDHEAILRYFMLRTPLQELSDLWASRDPRFSSIRAYFPGQYTASTMPRCPQLGASALYELHACVSASNLSAFVDAGARVLQQDPVECLFQFICSSNNHISRIHVSNYSDSHAFKAMHAAQQAVQEYPGHALWMWQCQLPGHTCEGRAKN